MVRGAASIVSVLVVGLVALTPLVVVPGAAAVPPAGHDRVLSADPTAATPAVDDGVVNAIAKVGDTMVAGGTFSSVTPIGGTSQNRSRVFAFSASSGALRSFAPSVNGIVNAVIPGPTAGTVYIGGSFSQVNGANHNKVALLDLATGNPVTGFRAAAMNGVVNELAVARGRLVVGGNFTTAGGAPHGGLAALSTASGAVDPYLSVDVTDRHNDSGSGAQGAVGVRDLDVTEDGTRLVAIGNFKRVDGLDRDQLVMISLGSSSATVTTDWQTNRYKPYCFSWAYDSYMRGVSFSPDGSYFVVATTGGHNSGTLCDTAARFETAASGSDLQPSWVNYSGGDTLWGVTVSETAVYVGGHQRWMNNTNGSDFAGPGAVPRAGVAALNTSTGVPLSWNPGRNPRGVAVYALLATSEGLWMGSNTDWVGNYRFRRPKLAMFPLAGGAPEAPDTTAGLPGTAYVGGGAAAARSPVLYRVNAGGPALGATDSGPDWARDEESTSDYRNSGSNAAGWSSGSGTDATVPASTPNAVFDSERWSPSDDPALEWDFPVASGTPLQVRLYFSNRCSCTSAPGSRVFDVAIDDTTVLDDFDIVRQVGDQVGTMRSVDISSDGNVDIDFSHVVENPLVNAIEIVRTDLPAEVPDASSLRAIDVSDTGAGPASEVDDGDIDWEVVRGAFLAGGTLFYGKGDGTFNRRAFDDGQFGPEQLLDPYHDPAWADVMTGSGGTYDGNRPALYGQMSGVRGMAYHRGRLYYTLTGSSQLFWRWFNVDSGIIGADAFTASAGRDWGDVGGMFATDDRLYFVTRSSGNLNRIALGATGPIGSPSVVDGPAAGGNNWNGRALFLADGEPANASPEASFEVSCIDMVCELDGSGSADPDGSIERFEWDFGDGDVGSGQLVNHQFDEPGTYEVALTVVDDDGASGTVSRQVEVSESPATEEISHVGSASRQEQSAAPQVPVPAGTEAGDTLLMSAAINNGNEARAPSGWTRIGLEGTASFATAIWTKQATAADLSGQVAVTLPAARRTAMTMSSYRGVSGDDPVAASAWAQSQNATEHTTPDVDAPNGSHVVWLWSDKGPSTSAWTLPVGTPSRTEVYSPGSGRVSTVVGDSDGPVSGTVDGRTAVTDATSSRSVTWSVALTADGDAGEPGGGDDEGPPATGEVSYVASSSGVQLSAAPEVAVPSGTRAGDTLVMSATVNNSDKVEAPAGWTLVGQRGDASFATAVWTRRATAADVGGTGSVTLPEARRTAMTMASYRGVSAEAPVGANASAYAQSTAQHTTPEITAPSGSRVVWLWSDKGASTSAWTMPPGTVARTAAYSTGSGRVSAAVADSDGPVSGTVPGRTAQTDATSARGVTWSLALRPE